MSGDLKKNLKFISQDSMNSMIEELRLEADKGPLDIKPYLHRYFTGVITYMVSIQPLFPKYFMKYVLHYVSFNMVHRRSMFG